MAIAKDNDKEIANTTLFVLCLRRFYRKKVISMANTKKSPEPIITPAAATKIAEMAAQQVANSPLLNTGIEKHPRELSGVKQLIKLSREEETTAPKQATSKTTVTKKATSKTTDSRPLLLNKRQFKKAQKTINDLRKLGIIDENNNIILPSTSTKIKK